MKIAYDDTWGSSLLSLLALLRRKRSRQMSGSTAASTIETSFEHLREVDIGVTELVAPITSWLSTRESLWRPMKHVGFKEIPKEHLDILTVAFLFRKVQTALAGYKVCQ
jgi:hypothetical protein